MISGNTPFYGDSKESVFKSIINDEVPMKIYFSLNAKDLLKKLLCKDPDKRLGYKSGAKEIRNHPFYSSIHWNDLTKMRKSSIYYLLSKLQENQIESKDIETCRNSHSYNDFSYVKSPHAIPKVKSMINLTEETQLEITPEKVYF